MDNTLIQRAPSREAIHYESRYVTDSRQEPRRRENWPILGPLLATVLLSLLIRKLDLDQRVSALFYDSINGVWPFERAQPWLWFYRNGTLPPLIVGIVGAVVAIFGSKLFYSSDPRKIKQIRLCGLFLALLLIIGPGLLVNASLKSVWGRPRPLQCAEFGGEKTFLPVGEWASQRFPNSSFPSGHAAVAFYLMGLGFIVSPRNPWLRWSCFGGGLAYGVAMGATRVLQGGHFLSDVLWAGALVYFVSVGLAWLLISHD